MASLKPASFSNRNGAARFAFVLRKPCVILASDITDCAESRTMYVTPPGHNDTGTRTD